MEPKIKITIYATSEFFGSVTKTEGTLVKFGTEDYAQFHNCPFVQYIPKGKRKTYGRRSTYKPYLLVIEGHGHPEPDGMFGPERLSADGAVTIKESRYRSFDERFETEFDEKITEYLKEQKVVIDYRHTVGTTLVNDEKHHATI